MELSLHLIWKVCPRVRMDFIYTQLLLVSQLNEMDKQCWVAQREDILILRKQASMDIHGRMIIIWEIYLH